MDLGLKGLKALVTGGTKGIGRRCAEILADEGAHVAVCARDGGGPTLIESVSLRWRGHAGHDPAKYVPEDLLERYVAEEDPVRTFEERLLGWGVVTKEDVEEIQGRVERAFEEGYEYALASPFPEPEDAFKGNWTDDGYWTSEPGRGGGTEA